jgi:tetratricopeptide (TPR) repeat protein
MAQTGNDTPAIGRARAMVERFADNPVPRFSLAQALQDAGRQDDALVEWRAVVALKDDYMLAWLRLAECAMTAERWPEAKEAAEKALALGIAQDHQGPQAEARAMLMEIEDEL